MSEDINQTRRKAMKATGAVGVGMMLSNPVNVLASQSGAEGKIQSRGYAAFDTSGKLAPWKFERRPVGDNDVLIDIKYASICHSDIHQEKGHWGPQQYPQVPGHEMVGIVAAVGKNVTKFKVGDRAGVGCMVGGCHDCNTNEEQYGADTIFTYGYPDKRSPTGISQGGYSNNIVVEDHYAVHVPEGVSFEEAAPLMCAGITTYSPLMRADLKPGTKVGVAGIGGLGHMAVKIALSKGAEVYAFTTSPSKVKDILAFGAKEVIVVDDISKLGKYRGQMDYMISTIPYGFDVVAYAAVVKPYGTFTQVGMPEKFEVTMNALSLAASRVNFNSSLIGGMQETQEMVNYCVEHNVLPKIEMISAKQINDAWENVVNKKARYRYVIDASTF
ncbi:NAD(P)-dependent alcohol dehydrogenase [Vibrio mangrovi]|uniref:NAD(P)-dependent alcohol dehydrogenase n=1 Tax=Vibrio mangrovi TaxID=474394 RepID=A0A1Y6IN41_9VIBR|nr:NAD(P)-dependent alcohol dehydrogenase [Vibrio mangrovi]MDW6004147.1 NAD(P)-dependent alcohol dehydrogenase [Vibrio mangrovi]SMR99056.1 NADP-dependent alcohol dehydrogenase C 2 [Vibrio mangrovi]